MGIDRFDLRVEWRGVPWLRAWPTGNWRLLDPESKIFQYAETWIHVDRAVVERVAGMRDGSTLNPQVRGRVLQDFFDVEFMRAAAVQSRRWKTLARRYREVIVGSDEDPGTWEKRWREADSARIAGLEREAEERRRREEVEALLRDKELECDELMERISAVIGTTKNVGRRRPRHGDQNRGEDASPVVPDDAGVGHVPGDRLLEPCDGPAGRCVHLRETPLAVSCMREPALLRPVEVKEGATWCPGKEIA